MVGAMSASAWQRILSMAKEGVAQQHGVMIVFNRHLDFRTGCRPDDKGIPWQGKEGSLTTAQIKVDRATLA